jgi:hypothetical protein
MIYRPRRSTSTLKGVTYSRSAATKQKPMKMAVALVPSQQEEMKKEMREYLTSDLPKLM